MAFSIAQCEWVGESSFMTKIVLLPIVVLGLDLLLELILFIGSLSSFPDLEDKHDLIL
jgi:hypothetical protein